MRIQGFETQKLKKIYSWKSYIFFINNCNLPIPSPPWRTSKLQKKPSALKREHPALQNRKFLNFFYFCGSFLLSWIRIRIRIRIHWPDWIRIQIRNPAIQHCGDKVFISDSPQNFFKKRCNLLEVSSSLLLTSCSFLVSSDWNTISKLLSCSVFIY